MKLLFNHTCPANSYLIESYPYGFNLRCKMRYWLECNGNKGVRFASQTSNPKKNDVWNKPKYSTYSRFGGAMFLDENDHVQWKGVNEYFDLKELIKWNDTYGEANHPDCKETFSFWLKKKMAFDKAKSEGKIIMTVNGVPTETLKPELEWPKGELLSQELEKKNEIESDFI